jgi:hypothetical protein
MVIELDLQIGILNLCSKIIWMEKAITVQFRRIYLKDPTVEFAVLESSRRNTCSGLVSAVMISELLLVQEDHLV